MSISYDPRTLSWNVTPEKTDYKIDNKTDYEFNRKTDHVTDLPVNTELPSLLPVNLRYNYSTTLPTDLKTNYNEQNEYQTRVGILKRTTKQGEQTQYTFGTGNREIRFTPVKDDTFTYRYRTGDGRYGPTYATATITGFEASLAKALVEAGFPESTAAQYGVSNSKKVKDVWDENQKNIQLNAENRQKNIDNEKQNQANRLLNEKNFQTNLENAQKNFEIEKERFTIQQQNEENLLKNAENLTLNKLNTELNQKGKKLNEQNAKLNEENAYLNTTNSAKNDLYNKTLQIASSTQGGDYVNQRDKINAEPLIQAGLTPEEAAQTVEQVQSLFKDFYRVEKLQRWDPGLGTKPPYGTFDPDYYKAQNPAVAQAYQEALAKDDIDITERYGEESFYLQHYTNIGKNQGLRANKEEDLLAAERYTEDALTDLDIQNIRDYQLGIDKESITERLLNIPEVSNEWAKARMGDEYWNTLAKEKYLNVNDPDEFSVLFRLSERPQDKQLMLNTNVSGGQGITQLEEALNEAIGAKAEIDVKKFGALNQTILKDAIEQMKKTRAEQEMLSFYRGFEGFSEVVDINQELSNSILGDSGVGGILSFMSGDKAEKGLLDSLQNLTGIRNNVTYNWQQWFDKSIKDKYGIDYAVFEPLEEKKDIINSFLRLDPAQKAFDETNQIFNKDFLKSSGFASSEALISFLEGQGEEGLKILNTIKSETGEQAKQLLMPILSRIQADIKLLTEQKDRDIAVSYTADDVTQLMNIDAQFARDYIDEYLTPRFNTSKSMEEFIDYLNVQEEEKNPFQTQDTYDALSLLANLYSKDYLDKISLEGPKGFDPEYYFNPSGDDSRADQFLVQKQTVEEDWEKAKAGDDYWQSQAYRFGIDINNKADFARMHFEVKGQGKGFDAADDITNASKIQNFLYETVVPALKEEAFKQTPIFGQFIRPESFADEILKGLDPYKTPEDWQNLLKQFKLDEKTQTVDAVRDYIIEAIRTGSASDIRSQIEYLNKKREKPTQELLGISYIERPEDYQKSQQEDTKATTELYSVFRNAGYQGSEDDFYNDFFPDLDRTEQVSLTAASKGQVPSMFNFSFEDPVKTLGSFDSFFEDLSAEPQEEEDSFDGFLTDYFKMKDEDPFQIKPTYSANKKFLDDFTFSLGSF